MLSNRNSFDLPATKAADAVGLTVDETVAVLEDLRKRGLVHRVNRPRSIGLEPPNVISEDGLRHLRERIEACLVTRLPWWVAVYFGFAGGAIAFDCDHRGRTS